MGALTGDDTTEREVRSASNQHWNSCRRTLTTDDYDYHDRRREHDTPEQVIKTIIVKLGEVVSRAPSCRECPVLMRPTRILPKRSPASQNRYVRHLSLSQPYQKAFALRECVARFIARSLLTLTQRHRAAVQDPILCSPAPFAA